MCEPALSIVSVPSAALDSTLFTSGTRSIIRSRFRKVGEMFHFYVPGYGHSEAWGTLGVNAFNVPPHLQYEVKWWNTRSEFLDGISQGFRFIDANNFGNSVSELAGVIGTSRAELANCGLDSAFSFNANHGVVRMAQLAKFLEATAPTTVRLSNYSDKLSFMLLPKHRMAFQKKAQYALSSSNVRKSVAALWAGQVRRRAQFEPHISDVPQLWVGVN